MNAWSQSTLRTAVAAVLAIPGALRGQETTANCASPSPGVIPSCTATERLQELSTTLSEFTAPASTVITTTAGNGIEGSGARNWNLTNRGSITGFTGGVSLTSHENVAATFENFGSVTGNGGNGVTLTKGGTLINHVDASIASTQDAVSMTLSGDVINDGLIHGSTGGATHTSVYFGQGGRFSQSATGEVEGVHGVQFNVGLLIGNNAGSISVSGDGLLARTGSIGTFSNTGTIVTTGHHASNMAAVRAQGSASLTLTGDGSIRATGNGAFGIYATDAGTTVSASDLQLTSETGGGTGVYAETGAAVTLTGGSVTTSTSGARGLLASSQDSLITADNVAVTTSGDGAETVVARDGGALELRGGSVITTSGMTASGASLFGRSQLVIDDSTVSALGAGSAALSASPFGNVGEGTATIGNSTLSSAQAAGVAVNGTTLHATFNRSTLLGAALSQTAGSGILHLSASASTLTGAALTEAGSETHYSLRDSTLWNLNGDSTLTSLTLDDAIVRYGGAFGLAGAISLDSGGGSIDTNGFDVPLAQPLAGAGALTKRGAGTLILPGDSAHTGGTTISGGTLQLGDGGATGNVAGPIDVNGTLTYYRSDAQFDIASSLSGGGVVRFRGVGVSAESSYRAQTIDPSFTGSFVVEGDARFQVDGAGESENASILVENNGTLFVSTPDTLASPLSLAGEGWLDGGAGRLGALRMSSNAQLSGQVTLTDDAHIMLYFSGDQGTISGPITDGGNGFELEKRGDGTLVITGAVGVATTTISAGTLQVGDGSGTGSIRGHITNNAALVFDRSDLFAHGDAISGSGTLTQAGTGTLTLSGASSYTGLTTAAAGRLRVNGSIGSDVLVDGAATLGGTGTIGGSVTVADAGHLAPGRSVGTLQTGNLLMNAGSLLDYELGLANRPGGVANDLTVVNGDLTLDGVLNIADVAGLGAREVNGPGAYGATVYRLFDYSGSLTDSGLEIGSLPDGFTSGNVTIDTATPGQVNLNVLTGGAVQFWDGQDLSPDGEVNGGSAIWASSVSDWTNSAGAYNGEWQGGVAVFEGEPGTVTLGADIDFAGMLFATDGYRIASNDFALQATASNTLIRVASGTAVVDAPIAGSTQLVKTGEGVLELGGTNAFARGVRIDGGALQVEADAALGSVGAALALDNGTLITTGSFASTRDVSLGIDGGTIDAGGGTELTLSGAIHGAGELRKVGAGRVILGAVNSYTGGTLLQSGVVEAGSDAAFGATTGALEFGGGTLTLGASFDPAATRPVFLDTAGGSIDTNGFETELAQIVSGAGALTKLGPGTLTLAADNTYAGGTEIAAGTLRIGDGGTTGSVIGDIGNDGALVFERSNGSAFGGVVSGSGSLEKRGAGLLLLTANQSYTGGTTITGGALQLGNGGTSGGVVGDIANEGTLVFNRSDEVMYGGVISGTGSLTQAGDGALILSADQTYTGGTTISAGSLQLGDGGTSGSIVGDITDNAALVFNRSDDVDFTRIISGTGSVTQAGAGTLILARDHAYTGGTTIAAGTLQIGAGGSSGSVAGDIANESLLVFNRSDAFTFGGVVSGAGALTHTGAGRVILTADHTYTGGTTIAAGTLQIGDGGANGSIVGDITDNAALVFNRPDALTFRGVIRGAGTLTQAGAGMLILTDNNTYTGGTTIAAGALQIGDGNTSGRILGNVTDNAALVFNRSDGVTFAGLISGTGSVEQAGTGTLTFATNHIHSGGTTISAGTLQLGNGGTSGSVAGDITNNGVLAFNRSDNLDFTNSIEGTGSVVKRGVNTLTMSGISTYSGPTHVDAGRLQVAGSLISDVTIATGAMLGGNGIVGGIANAGITAPGASIGTLHVTGDFSQSSTAVLQVEFDDQGHVDALDIGGAASLDGQVVYLPDPASAFGQDLTYTYVTAAGGVSGTFDPVTQDHAGVLFETRYSANSVQLRIDSVPIVDNIVSPGGADLVACVASLDAQRSSVAGTRAAPTMNALVMTPVAALPATIHGICPRDPSVLPSSIDAQINARFGVLANRLAEAHLAAGGAPGILDAYELRAGVNFWLRGAYLDGAEDPRDILRTGYDSHSDSLAMGIDVALNDTGVLGGYLVRDDLDLDYRAPVFMGGDSAQVEDRAWSAGLYGSYWSASNWFLQGIIEYGLHEVESTRTMAVGLTGMSAEGERDARVFAAGICAGYNFEPATHWLLQPTLALQYHRTNDDAYTETGADSLNLSYASLEADTLRGEAGFTARRAIGASLSAGNTTAFYVFANYLYDQPLDDRNRTAHFAIAEPFEITGDESGRDGVHYGLGFENTWQGNTSLQIVIDAESYGEIETLGASLQFRRRF